MSSDLFDDKAATWDDDPRKVERAAAVAESIAKAVPLDPSMRILEYGAGTGLVTQALGDRVGPAVLADTSAGMRSVIYDKIEAGAIPDGEVWSLDLSAEAAPDDQFDLIVTVMVLHHIPDLDKVLSGFAGLLRPGGYVCIADLEKEDGSFHGEGFAGHDGFERPALAASLERAGVHDIRFDDCHHMVKNGATYPIFLATGRR